MNQVFQESFRRLAYCIYYCVGEVDTKTPLKVLINYLNSSTNLPIHVKTPLGLHYFLVLWYT